MTLQALETPTIGSFLLHRAWEGGYCPATLAHRMGLSWSFWTRDIDRSLSEAETEKISQAFNIDTDEVGAMTFTYLLGSAGIKTRRNGFQKWLTPVGIYHRKRLRYGQLYCAKCFKAGHNQLRMEWRLASSWICAVHNSPLQDSCPHCDAPFAPFRQDALMISRCDRCSNSLLSVPSPDESVPKERELQLKARVLWKQALEGNGRRLSVFHDLLTHAATNDAAFKRAGEPWSYWRLAERRELLMKVVSTFNVKQDYVSENLIEITKPVSKAKGRRRQSLPKDPASRAEMLLNLAARMRFPRRDKARIGKFA